MNFSKHFQKNVFILNVITNDIETDTQPSYFTL